MARAIPAATDQFPGLRWDAYAQGRFTASENAPPLWSLRHTYGLGRFEVLAALLDSATLEPEVNGCGATGFIASQASQPTNSRNNEVRP